MIEPKPNPNEVGEAIGHRKPKKEEGGIGSFDPSGAEPSVEDAIIDREIKKAPEKANEEGLIFLFPDQKSRQQTKKGDVEIDVEIVHAARSDDFALSDKSHATIVHEEKKSSENS